MLTLLSSTMFLAQQRVSSLTGNIRRHPGFESKILKNKRNILVYLPPQYATEKNRKFPVLYMADGQNCFDGMTSYIPNQEWRADETAEDLIGRGLVEPLIIIAIDNGQGARADEYLPTQARMGQQTAGGRAHEYGNFLTAEVMPMIARNYRVATGPDRTGICGSSFGGVLSLYLAGERPGIFGKSAVVSPSLWWDNQIMLKWATKKDFVRKPRLWIDIGTAEGADAVRQTAKLADILTNKGFQADKDLVCVFDPGAQHNEKAWAKRFPMMLKFLFPKRS